MVRDRSRQSIRFTIIPPLQLVHQGDELTQQMAEADIIHPCEGQTGPEGYKEKQDPREYTKCPAKAPMPDHGGHPHDGSVKQHAAKKGNPDMEGKASVTGLAEDRRKVKFVSLVRLQDQTDKEAQMAQDPRRQAYGGHGDQDGGRKVAQTVFHDRLLWRDGG